MESKQVAPAKWWPLRLFSNVGSWWFRKKPDDKINTIVIVLASIATVLCVIRSIQIDKDSVFWSSVCMVLAAAVFGAAMGSTVERHLRISFSVLIALIIIALIILIFFS